MKRLSKTTAVLALVSAASCGNLFAQHIPSNLPTLNAGMSGLWFNPEQPAHAIQVEILEGARALVGWYTFDSSGEPLWLVGSGSFVGLDLMVELQSFSGGRPPAQWESAQPEATPWGTLAISFAGCDTAEASWASSQAGFGNGSLELARFSSIHGQRCMAEESYSLQLSYSFERRLQDFETVFADLPANHDSSFYELDFQREELPPPVHGFHGLRISGNNHSDDLAMVIKKAVPGLMPDTIYRVELEADIASNVPSGCSGVGGSPGESVYLKLGASPTEPVASPDPVDNWLRLNVDIGNQATDGQHARLVGDLANSYGCEDSTESPWDLKTVTTQGQPLLVSTDSEGTLWVFAASDSGFEGLSTWYLTGLRVRLEPYPPEL